ncbi:hypothetical protein WA026_000650 [Henosepilachna vigintioctopunctata]|uniref:Death domain-containing protein n=1 Tax=Henosepilachna vigintioctopunctata TaxID=420089 RepID=A0AAW1V5M1_9CUCU
MMNDYVTLKNDILRISLRNHSTIIEILKKNYEKEVNSIRSSSKIYNIQDLITILEKRDFLNGENINNLIELKSLLEGYIGERVNYRNLQTSFSNISHIDNRRIVGSVPRINSASYNDASTSQNVLYQCSNSRINDAGYDIAETKAYKVIATEIGKKWMNFGRTLKVKEHTLDELSLNYSRIEDRVYKILAFHKEECDPRYYRSRLMDGLVEARRQDLRKKVQDIFDMHST